MSSNQQQQQQTPNPNHIKTTTRKRLEQKMQKNVIRVRVKTNKYLDMIVAIESDKTIRELAHRVLHCFHQLAEQHVAIPPKRRDLTVSAIKIDGFYISKSEIVENLIKDNDQIQCEFSKAKPKFPNYPQAYENSMKQATVKNSLIFNSNNKSNERVLYQRPIPIITHQVKQMLNNMKESQKTKKQRKKEKKRLKLLQAQAQIQEQNKEKYNNYNNNQVSSFKFKEQEQERGDYQNQNYKNGKQSKEIQRFSFGFGSSWQDNKPVKQYPKTPTFQIMNSQQKYKEDDENQHQKQSIKQQRQSKNYQNQTIQQEVIEPLDTTIQMIKSNNKSQSNINVETKKQVKPEQGRNKKNVSTSILEILSKASEQRQKKNKKKDKKQLQKIDEVKVESSKSIQNISQNSLNPGSLKTINGNKNEKQFVPNNKIASPKVTFHSSPMLSPQRKISNPSLQKMDLQGNFDLMNSSKTSKKQIKTEPTPTSFQPSPSLPSQIEPQLIKKQPLLPKTPKIIVQQDSQAQSCQASTKAKQEQKNQQATNTNTSNYYQSSTTTSAKLAALNAKISKYKLKFFNDSSDQEDQNKDNDDQV